MQNKLCPNILLAKSFDSGHWKGSYGLVGHTADVVNAVTVLLENIGQGIINQFDLKCSWEGFRATARLSAYLHDWGKANDHFQMMVRGKRDIRENPQLIRHELASMLLAWEYREWLQQCPNADFLTALVAAGGHHLKLGWDSRKQSPNDELGEIRNGSGSDRLYLYTEPQYFRGMLKHGVKALGLPKQLKLSVKPSREWTVNEIKSKRQLLLEDFIDWQVTDSSFVSVVKALIIAADTVGSALPNTDLKISDWIEKQVSVKLTESEVEQVVNQRLNGQEMRPFQVALGESQLRVTLARAGCGTGKTLGAYNWAKRYAVNRKLFFCYPTTGTSTEGFIDYVHDRVDSVLLHSRSDVDLAHLMLTGDDDDISTKLESFKTWGTKVSVCTVDTVLGLLQCNRRPMYCFPAIAQAAFVFDEVHCYDNRLFGGLLRFLEVVKAPVLLMSASFLPWQLEAIQKAVGKSMEIIEGAKELELLPRYRFHLSDNPDWERVTQELEKTYALPNGEHICGKVLWVCNQVSTAITVYKDVKQRGLNAVLYHSRYRYQDRVDHHRAVIAAFKGNKPVIAIATQVAEMSLDLSATLLVSQIANPAGLIQRLGRLNRRYIGQSLDAIFYPDPKVRFPYSQEDLDSGRTMLETFTDEVSQAALAEWLERSPQQGKPDKETVLFNEIKKWQAYPAPCREAGHTVTALLEQDKQIVDKLPAKVLPKYTIPLLSTKKVQKWERHRKGYPIAPSREWAYSTELGAYLIKGGDEN
ncbi:MAG: CRISPR-associated helicase Cas3' [Microcystis sp.]|jgi:CRISPR-associated endonuclease/helicase Cas3|uniref:CRISPR-associated helicase Cas3' n=1 Tax=unclassified Microcystis TaxID=2643300 RepID=UPI0022C361AE|nr:MULTISPECIES: CRISPR-associated helicase Cas3' [unclassified Microcystis]MCE2671238.1 CRISPR-associated helicase Cas3' [Microcystis sp. 49638_E5]MCZ8056888.1 CRISPR-associated helicase Cas3' [Microcystis sp. LE19-12.2C]MDJ0548826.1 CRISPR-associated helicase Cas3' [Microcystis sp. M49637_WE12]MDJ0587264.1 CRISPR-associated helicase Cas3' [Microcystis sp. M49636_WE2]